MHTISVLNLYLILSCEFSTKNLTIFAIPIHEIFISVEQNKSLYIYGYKQMGLVTQEIIVELYRLSKRSITRRK